MLLDSRFKTSTAPIRPIKAIQFSVMNPEYMKAVSVTQEMEYGGEKIERGITKDSCYDQSTGQANYGSINDPRMGNMFDSEHPGYFGHIELVRPVYHIGFLKIVIDVLRCVSYYTSALLVDKNTLNLKKGKKRNLKELTKVCKLIKRCPTTERRQPSFMKEGTKISIDFGPDSGIEKTIISPLEVYRIFEKISDADVEYLGFNPALTRPEHLLITVLFTPPIHVRPSVFMSSSQKCDDDLTTKLNEIVKTNIALKHAIEKNNQDNGANEHYISQLESLLQYNINTFIDNQHPGQPPSLQRSGKPLKTLRERLSGKDGRVRGNLMGKRVDFSARTVITADPNLSVDEVGVPLKIAMNLTKPEVVTPYNKEQLLTFVKNGPGTYPGAKFLMKGITKIDLHYAKNITELENGWVVERHLLDNDAVLFNRQPSLHKMSMMSHKVRVLPGSTFRLNLACVNAYNADFDGDEMNLHVPQSLTAQAEAENLMNVTKLIVSPQANKPVMNIIQDSLLACAKITRRDVLIGRKMFMNMITFIQNWDRCVPPPAIIHKGREYWTGKQIMSMIIPEKLTLNKMPDLMNIHDRGIFIQRGKILSGSMDKSVVGKSNGGLIHVLFHDFGPNVTKLFINQVQTLVNYWIRQKGYTISIGDTVPSKDVEQKVNEMIQHAQTQVQNLIMERPRNIERQINSILNALTNESGKYAEESLTFANNFKAAVSSGSKGSNINISQIMAIVGQQNIEGQRVRYGFKDRTLPHFEKHDIGKQSRGFVENSYLKGLNPQEFFFHAMAGREGIIDTAFGH